MLNSPRRLRRCRGECRGAKRAASGRVRHETASLEQPSTMNGNDLHTGVDSARDFPNRWPCVRVIPWGLVIRCYPAVAYGADVAQRESVRHEPQELNRWHVTSRARAGNQEQGQRRCQSPLRHYCFPTLNLTQEHTLTPSQKRLARGCAIGSVPARTQQSQPLSRSREGIG